MLEAYINLSSEPSKNHQINKMTDCYLTNPFNYNAIIKGLIGVMLIHIQTKWS